VAQIKAQKALTEKERMDAFDRRHDYLSSLVSNTFPKYFMAIYRVRNRVETLADCGGQDYNEALQVIKSAKDSEVDWAIAQNLLIG
jgi:hypothetical protein